MRLRTVLRRLFHLSLWGEIARSASEGEDRRLEPRARIVRIGGAVLGFLLVAWPAFAGDEELTPDEIAAVIAADVSAPATPVPGFLVGAARASLDPAPALFGGTTWQTSGCSVYGTDGFAPTGDHLLPDPSDPETLPGQLRGWPDASPDCIYLGGFGLGPVRPAARVGQGGVWVRAIAISNGQRTFVYAIADTVGWFARYDERVCADCGIRDVREAVASAVGLDVGDVIVGSTHTHAGADTYGGWGGIPSWYRSQLRDAAIAAAKQSIASLRPATLTVGEVHLRHRNNERRDTYYSTTDTGATWVQARETAAEPCAPEDVQCPPVIATWMTYAGHPTIVGDAILHADWPGASARRLEATFGGVGLVFEGGLGNVSVSGLGGASDEERAEATGIAIADDVTADILVNGRVLLSNAMQAAAQDIVHPATTNPGLTTLASVGLFDREFTPGSKGGGTPGVYAWSKRGELSTSGENNDVPAPEAELPPVPGERARACVSAGPVITTTAGAHRIGELLVAFGPGEIFSNLAEVVKERADGSAVTMVLGQTNDALGYIIQSFEYDLQGNAATEYGTTTGEYEEVFSIDRCFGDHVLEAILESTRALGAGG